MIMKTKGCLMDECRCMKKHGRLIKSCKWRMKNNLLRRDEYTEGGQKRITALSEMSEYRNHRDVFAICKRCGKFRNTGADICKCKRNKAGRLIYES